MTEATQDSPTSLISVRQWCSQNRHFLVVATILAVVWAGWTSIMSELDMVFRKEAVPWPPGVKVDPDEFRMLSLPKSFGPGNRFELIEDSETILKKDVRLDMGIGIPEDVKTVEERKSGWYVSRAYADRQAAGSRGKYRQWKLDVTYYTGMLSKVPHVPERCLEAAGMTLGKEGNVKFEVPDAPGPWGSKPVTCRFVEFYDRRGNWETHHVQYYVLSLNGYPESSWEMVRLKMISPFGKYVYFAKIQFNPLNEIEDLDEAKQAAEEFVKYMLPEVLKALPMPEDIKRLESGAP